MTTPTLLPRSLLAASSALAMITALASVPAAQAQETATETSDDSEILTLEPIIVSAGLTPWSASTYGRAVTVITAEQIEEQGITYVQDALRTVPGVSVSSAGTSNTQIRIRGGEASHTLILIDGVQADGGAGEYVLTGFNTADIERIEVLRGPQSAFYGSNASTGVINIITRDAAPGLHYGAAVEVGNGYNASANVSQRSENGGVSLRLFDRNDKGYDVSGSGGEKDRIRSKGYVLKGDWQATDDLKFGFTLRQVKSTYDWDSTSYVATDADGYVVDDPEPFTDQRETTGSVWADYSMLDGRMEHHLEYQDSVIHSDPYNSDETRGETEKLKYRMGIALDGAPLEFAAHSLTVMVEGRRDTSTTAEGETRKTTSYAAEYRGTLFDGFDLQAGLRYDDNSAFSNDTSWNLGASYRLTEGLRLHASGGKAVVNPSFYELFANDSWTLGNPNLAPEINKGYDIGIEARFPAMNAVLDVTYFNERMSNEITYVSGAATDGSGRAMYINASGESPRQGVEVSGTVEPVEGLTVKLGYTYTDAKGADDAVEVRRPGDEFTLDMTLRTFGGRGSISGSLRHVANAWDAQYWGSYETVKLPDYTVVNVAAQYELTEVVTLNARIANLFDEQYYDVWGYAAQGRQAYVGVSAQW